MADPATNRFVFDPRWMVAAVMLVHWALVVNNDIGIAAKYSGVDQALSGQRWRLVEVLAGSILLGGLFTRHSRIAGIVLGLLACGALAGAIAYVGMPRRLLVWAHSIMALLVVAGCAVVALKSPDASAK